MAEKISSFFTSTIGFVLGILFTFGVWLPLNVIGFPLWADILIIVGLQLTLIVGRVISVGFWVWGLIILLGSPITTFSIIYFVAFGLYVLYLGFVLLALALDR